MKSIFTKFSSLLLMGAVALAGCTDFSADLQSVDKKVDDLAASTGAGIKALQEEIATLKTFVAETYATKAELKAVEDQLTPITEDITALEELVATKADQTEIKASVDALAAKVNAIKSCACDVAAVANQFAALQAQVDAAKTQIDALKGCECDPSGECECDVPSLQGLSAAVETFKGACVDYQTTTDEKLKEIDDQLAKISTSTEVEEDIAAAISEAKTVLQGEIAEVESAVEAVQTAFATADQKIEEKINNLDLLTEDDVEAVVAEAIKEFQGLNAIVEQLKKDLEALTGRVDALETSLRSVVLVPETVYNGTKAVKFHRVEGENVLKTFANVSFHFNPSNFDVTSAKYEVMAENVEFMTKAAADAPAIEIVGEPVQEGDKVTFLFERAEGAGNMFALKVTLADGTVIYSEYAAILDEANYAVAEATVSVEVSRLALELPKINSLSSLIEAVKSAGTVIEDFQGTIDAIKTAYEAATSGNILNALKAFNAIPGFATKNATVTGYGTYTVKVESMTAETLYEDLMKASSMNELMTQLQALIGKAEGLGGEKGAEILEGLKELANNNELSDLSSTIEKLNNQLFSEEAIRDNAYAMLENSKGDLEELKAKAEQLRAEGANSVLIGLADAAVAAGEIVVREWEEKLEGALAVVEGIRAKIDEYSDKLFQDAKDYIANSEVGAYIKELENTIAEKGWEGKKAVAKIDAETVASAEALKNLIANYNALNDTVVEEFNNSIFGKVLSIIESQEAADAFEQLGLSALHTALKQIPEIATLITKYYPADMQTIEGVLGFLGGLKPEVTTTWVVDYELAK